MINRKAKDLRERTNKAFSDKVEITRDLAIYENNFSQSYLVVADIDGVSQEKSLSDGLK